MFFCKFLDNKIVEHINNIFDKSTDINLRVKNLKTDIVLNSTTVSCQVFATYGSLPALIYTVVINDDLEFKLTFNNQDSAVSQASHVITEGMLSVTKSDKFTLSLFDSWDTKDLKTFTSTITEEEFFFLILDHKFITNECVSYDDFNNMLENVNNIKYNYINIADTTAYTKDEQGNIPNAYTQHGITIDDLYEIIKKCIYEIGFIDGN